MSRKTDGNFAENSRNENGTFLTLLTKSLRNFIYNHNHVCNIMQSVYFPRYHYITFKFLCQIQILCKKSSITAQIKCKSSANSDQIRYKFSAYKTKTDFLFEIGIPIRFILRKRQVQHTGTSLTILIILQ